MTRCACLVAFLLVARASLSQEVLVNAINGVSCRPLALTTWGQDYFGFYEVAPGCGGQIRQIQRDGALLAAYDVCALAIPWDVVQIAPDTVVVLGLSSDGNGRDLKLVAVNFLTGAMLWSAWPDDPTPAWTQTHARLGVSSGGKIVVVWRDDQTREVLGRTLASDGTLDPGPVVLPELSGENHDPEIVATGSSLIVAWMHLYTTPFIPEVRLRVFDESLGSLTGDVVVNQSPFGFSSGTDLDLCSNSARAIVTWAQLSVTGTTDLRAREFDSAGQPIADELVFATSPSGFARVPRCGIDAQGLGIVAWSDVEGSGGGAYGRLMRSSTLVTSPFQINGLTYLDQTLEFFASAAPNELLPLVFTSHDLGGGDDVLTRRLVFPASLAVAGGPGPGVPTTVSIKRPHGLDTTAVMTPYGAPGFGANVGAGYIDGSSTSEVLTGPGPSSVYGPHVRAFRADATPVPKVSYYAYGTLRFGVRTTSGELEGDGFDEIVTAPGAGAVFGPHVRGWDYDGGTLRGMSGVSFFAYGTLKWGARAAGGDIDGDGMREIVTGPGPGPVFAPQVRGFDYDGGPLASIPGVSFDAFPDGFYGATVGAADVESSGLGAYGDGYQEIVVGRGADPAVGSDVALYDHDGASGVSMKELITPYASAYGATVAGGDVDDGDAEEVVTAPGPDPSAPLHVISWEWDPQILASPDPPALRKLGPDDFVLGTTMYGGNVAIGDFE